MIGENKHNIEESMNKVQQIKHFQINEEPKEDSRTVKFNALNQETAPNKVSGNMLGNKLEKNL